MAASIGGAASEPGIAPAVPVPDGGPAEAPAPGQGGTRRVYASHKCPLVSGHRAAKVAIANMIAVRMTIELAAERRLATHDQLHNAVHEAG